MGSMLVGSSRGIVAGLLLARKGILFRFQMEFSMISYFVGDSNLKFLLSVSGVVSVRIVLFEFILIGSSDSFRFFFGVIWLKWTRGQHCGVHEIGVSIFVVICRTL